MVFGLLGEDRAPDLFLELRVLGVVTVLRFLLGVEVIEVAEEFIEPVVGGQELVLVAEMVFPELPGHVAKRLEQLGDGRILLADAEVGAGQASAAQVG